MAEVKLVVMYPRPKDIDAFEKVYQNEHIPLAVAVLGGKTKIVGTKVFLVAEEETFTFAEARGA